MIGRILVSALQRSSPASMVRRTSRLLVTMAALCSVATLRAQTNTFPASGNVGIGTTSPGYPLQVNGAVGFNATLYGNGKDVMDTVDSYLRINQSSTFTNGIWIGTSNLLINTGGLFIGSQGGQGNVNIFGNGDGIGRIIVNGSPGSNSWFNTGGYEIGRAHV